MPEEFTQLRQERHRKKISEEREKSVRNCVEKLKRIEQEKQEYEL